MSNVIDAFSRASHSPSRRPVLVSSLVVVLAAAVAFAAIRSSDRHTRVAVRTDAARPTSGAPAAHVGDGVCSASLDAYGVSIGPATPTDVPQHTKSQAVAFEQDTPGAAPSQAGATRDAYFARVSHNSSLHNSAVAAGPLTNRAAWVVEVNNLNINLGNPKDPILAAKIPGAPTSYPDIVLHHTLLFMDDETGQELFGLSCP